MELLAAIAVIAVILICAAMSALSDGPDHGTIRPGRPDGEPTP